MGTYLSRTHRRHPRRARITIGPVTISAHPWFWAAAALTAVWAGIACLFAVLLDVGAGRP